MGLDHEKWHEWWNFTLKHCKMDYTLSLKCAISFAKMSSAAITFVAWKYFGDYLHIHIIVTIFSFNNHKWRENTNIIVVYTMFLNDDRYICKFMYSH